MYIRYNNLAKYYEYDGSNGLGLGPWIKLVIDYSQIVNVPPVVIPAHAPTHNTGGTDPITALAGGVITTGTIADARLSSNVAKLNTIQTFTVAQGWGGDAYFNLGLYERGRTIRIGEWASYNPSWTASGPVAPTNGSMIGKYMLSGKTCWFQIRLTFTGLTTFGTPGIVWVWSLPFTASGISRDVIGSAFLVDSGTIQRTGVTQLYDGNFCMVCTDNSLNFVGPTLPFTWTQPDELILNGCYQIN